MLTVPALGKLRGRRVVSSRVAWDACKPWNWRRLMTAMGTSTKRHRGVCGWLDAGHAQDWAAAS